MRGEDLFRKCPHRDWDSTNYLTWNVNTKAENKGGVVREKKAECPRKAKNRQRKRDLAEKLSMGDRLTPKKSYASKGVTKI